MKRRDLVRHLEKHGCIVDREGARHTIYWNPAAGIAAAVPRHREIKELVARAICDQLRVPRP